MNLATAHDWLARFGRRKNTRFAVNLPARITTLEGWQSADLINLSVSGAMLKITQAVTRSGTLLLQWQGYSVFGRVQWIEYDRVGVQFDHEIDDGVIAHSRTATRLQELHRRSEERQGEVAHELF